MSKSTDSATIDTLGQVLEFELGSEIYCVNIDHVMEIVDMGETTAIPNAPPHVEGVMDLRGSTTTIVNPKSLLGLDPDGSAHRIIVFDHKAFENDRSMGWVVDAVREVRQVAQDGVDDPPIDDDHIKGIVRRDDEFVIWVKPRELQVEEPR